MKDDLSLRLYLKEIGQVSLLTPEEEQELAKIIQGEPVKKWRDKPHSKKYNIACETMIKANLRLVVKIARDFEGRGMHLIDLIGEGNIGLMKGVERFKPATGAKFSTYGAWWIKQAMQRAIWNQSRDIRLPDHVYDKISKLNRAAREFHEKFGWSPDYEELACFLGVDADYILKLQTLTKAPIFLDMEVDRDGDSKELGEFVADENAVDPADNILKHEGLTNLNAFLQCLSEREQTILIRRYGLKNGTEETLEEIGVDLGVTRERVRQIQNIALRKLQRQFQAVA